MDDRKVPDDLSDHFSSYFGDNMHKHLLKALPSTDEFLTPTNRLIQRRREELENQKTMEALKQDFDHKLMAQRVREEELKQKENQLKTHLSNFHAFLKENQLKEARALKKAATERELSHQKAEELRILRKELKALAEKKEKLTTIVKKHEIYPRYLDQVVKACEQFFDPWELMSRTDTLFQTREELLTSTQQNQALSETSRAQFNNYLEQMNDKMLHLNNRLAKLHLILDQSCAETLLWENRWACIQNTAAKKTLLLGHLKMAILNLYQMTNRKTEDGEQPVAFDDTLKQLDKIQAYLQNLIFVWEGVNKN